MRAPRAHFGFLAAFLALLAVTAVRGGETVPTSPAAIQQELRSFATLGSVLYVAAHPDDENTQLITYLARGRGYRTAYLSVTRGDGGQNELGPEFGEKLGVARTQELLAARQLDGGRQFFTRALDFGFSKDVNETLHIWDRDKVLADVVRVIRLFRPDVVVAGFSAQQTPGQHGHHVASAVLAGEAFKLAGDPKAYPEQFTREQGGLTPWQPKRLFQNVRFGGAGNNASASPALVKIEAGGNDPVTNESFASIAARSRAMHKTQGLGNVGPAQFGNGAPRQESFLLLDGEPATNDIVDGIDTTFARFRRTGPEIAKLADEAIAQFKKEDPAASVPALLAIRAKLTVLEASPVVSDKRAQLDRILQACLGLRVLTTLPNAEVVPGEKLALHHAVEVHATTSVKWTAVRFPKGGPELKIAVPLKPGEVALQDSSPTLPGNTAVNQPYWLREEAMAGLFRVSDTKLIGQAENPPAFPVDYVFDVEGQQFVITDEPVQIIPNAPEAQMQKRLTVIPPVSLGFPYEVELFAPGATKPTIVEVTAARANSSGKLQLDTPAGWKVSPAQDFKLEHVGDKARFTFDVTAPAAPASGTLTATAEVGGARYSNSRVEINYPHLPVQILLPTTRLKVTAFDFAARGTKIGYLPGAGDSIAENLEQMGYAVTKLTGADLTPEKLRGLGLDAVVIGVRAFNERKDLAANLPGLFAWVEGGGTVIAQYNRPANNLPPLAPYKLSIAGPAPQLRITDENSPVTFFAPDHAALNRPNKITAADFQGWVQERGAYFPSSWDEQHFAPLLTMNDPGDAPLRSSILVAQHGKGYYVYTGLAFFRQLPAGVPGAYRLFANLVSLGKE